MGAGRGGEELESEKSGGVRGEGEGREGAGDMVQQFRGYTSFLEDSGSVSGSSRAHTVTSALGDSMPLASAGINT